MDAKTWVFPARGISRARGVLRANYAASLFRNAAPALRAVVLSRKGYDFVKWPAPALHHERRTAHILQQEKSRPPRVTFMQAGPLPGVLLPETLSVTVCLLPSRGSHSAPYRAKISGRDQYRQRPSSPKNLLPFSCQAARTQKKRGNTYE